MRKSTNRLKKTYTTLLMIAFSLACVVSSLSQGFSNGAIDFIFKPANSITQFAVWVENDNGEYVGTVFLTNFIGRRGGGNRTSDPEIDLSNGNRLSALPVWAYKRGVIDTTFDVKNYYPPASTKSSYPKDIDAVSKATPNQSVQRKTWNLSHLPYGQYKCRIESNQSFLFNPYHNYSFYRGQPSVVWNATIHVADAPDSGGVLDYTGYGSPDGSNGNVNAPDSTITTAAGLLIDQGGFRFKVVYKPAVTGVQDDFDGSQMERFFILAQNYPNPFNPETTIEFALPKSEYVSLKVFDAAGREVANLVSRQLNAGVHRIMWNAGTADSGVYFCRLSAGSFHQARKLVLMK